MPGQENHLPQYDKKQKGLLRSCINTCSGPQTDWKTLVCDGLHLSRRGSELLASMLIPALEQQLLARLPSEILLPPWDQLNHEDPSSSFKNVV